MKKFDLEAAQRGEEICVVENKELAVRFIGVRASGSLIVESKDTRCGSWVLGTYATAELAMKPRKIVKWGRFILCKDSLYNTLEEAEEANETASVKYKIIRLEWEE